MNVRYSGFMTKLVAILITLFLVAIPAKADVALWPSPVPGWTVIRVSGHIQQADFATFQSLTENVDPATTLVIVTGRGGNLVAGIGMGLRIRQKKLIVGAMSDCTSSCALTWIGGAPGRKFFYQSRPFLGLTLLCFYQASEFMHGPPSAAGNALIGKYLATLGYSRDMVEWATTADPNHRLCLGPELAKKFDIDLWYNTEDDQHYTLPGNHGLLPTTTPPVAQPAPAFPGTLASPGTPAPDSPVISPAAERALPATPALDLPVISPAAERALGLPSPNTPP
jgi:hypothetical protein